MDCATHYVRMHGYSQISEGGSCDDVLDVIRQHGICPEDAMPAPGSLVGDSLANFKVFFPELEKTVSSIVRKGAKEPLPHWQDSVKAVIDSPFLLAGYRDRWSADSSRNSRYNGSYNQPLYKP